ncbi:glycoside hydrolase family 5 protein, partial [Jaapia argillacea MUCL 33604]
MIISLTRCLAFVSLWCAVAASNIPSRTVTERGEPQFVQAHPNGKFAVNGKELEFVGTNAYWLPTLNTEADIEHAFKNFSSRGIRVVRTWFFNDVDTIPKNSNWLQLIEKGGKTTLNTGPNGLKKLDLVVTWAEKTGVYLIPSLTNNWNPLPPNGSPSRR